jgi:hypothetical protein
MNVYRWEYRLIWTGLDRKYDNTIFGNINGGEFLDQQSGSQDLKKVSVPRSYMIINKIEGRCVCMYIDMTHIGPQLFIYFVDWKIT